MRINKKKVKQSIQSVMLKGLGFSPKQADIDILNVVSNNGVTFQLIEFQVSGRTNVKYTLNYVARHIRLEHTESGVNEYHKSICIGF